jgi:acyl-CoA reductase-like NAD-dependent aldehyde dehydrogenase
MASIANCAEAWAAAGSHAKRAPNADRAEEWIVGPLPTVRLCRLLGDSLEQIHRDGRPQLGTGGRIRLDGRVEIDGFPHGALDRIGFRGFRGSVMLAEGIDRAAARQRQAGFYHQRDPDGGVSLVLGAGNVSSIPAMDVLSKMFVEGWVCLLKMNPVNEWAGPILDRALAPLVSAGYLRIVYGGGTVGGYLVEHPDVDDVHITGSDHTHDRIVWGPPGPDHDRRRAVGQPRLPKPISSELGNISPVIIMPVDYRDDQLAFMAANLATMVSNNASFNCNAAKMVITARQWPQHDALWGLVARRLAATPARAAYYPGAFDRYQRLTAGRDLLIPGRSGDGELPWTIIRGLDAGRPDPLFTTEPFCGLVSDLVLPARDPIEFLSTATRFCNDTLWGTLNAALMVAPEAERDGTVLAAIDRAVADLRYGTVAINHWPALGYGVGTLPWGGHPSSTLRNIGSGLGWVHNSFMLEGIEKVVVRGPLVVRPQPLWFAGNPKAVAVARRMTEHESAPSWRTVASVVATALL